VKWRTTNACDQ